MAYYLTRFTQDLADKCPETTKIPMAEKRPYTSSKVEMFWLHSRTLSKPVGEKKRPGYLDCQAH